MTREEQLRWEAHWGRFAGIAALAAAILTFLSGTVFIATDHEKTEATADFVLSVDDEPSSFIAGAFLSAVAALVLAGVFLYLFRAITARSAGVPPWFVYLVIGAPVAYAILRVASAFATVDTADDFASGTPIRGEAGDDRARDLLGSHPVLGWAQLVVSVAFAFLFVTLPLRARRVGLLTPFMAVLGVIAGALIVLPLRANLATIVQAFWLGGLGALLLGRWPGGRGPAWETGEAQPWPSARDRMAERTPASPAPSEAAEPEPVPERPPSRKRRKKRR